MRKTFPGYYHPTEDEFAELWDNCLFVLDANVLLNLYRYSRKTSEEFLSILDEVSDRLWVPHQAALEYQERRLDVISQQTKAYTVIDTLLTKTQQQIKSQLQGFQRHPSIDVGSLMNKLAETFEGTKEYLEQYRQEHPNLLETDYLWDTVTRLFEEKVGSPYSQERLTEIYEIGKERYKSKVPPGYEDGKKGSSEEPSVRKYGDLVLWLQTIDKAKEAQTPIVLVTDEKKEDWWRQFQGKIIGPRPELIKEMLSEAGVMLYMYRADPFLEHAQIYLEREIRQEAINEIREARQHDEDYNEKLLMKEIQTRWGEFLNTLRPRNLSLEALMRSCRPVAVEDGNTVIIGFDYDFHRGKVMEPRNRRDVEEALSTTFGYPMEIRSILRGSGDDF